MFLSHAVSWSCLIVVHLKNSSCLSETMFYAYATFLYHQLMCIRFCFSELLQPFQNGYRLGSTGGSSQAGSPQASESDPLMSAASFEMVKQVQ